MPYEGMWFRFHNTIELTASSSHKKIDGYYLLEKGEIVSNKHPLPDLIPFIQKVFEKDKQVGEYLRFRGWDFNKDGVIDMLEELNSEGSVVKRDYDFNSDGKSDHVD